MRKRLSFCLLLLGVAALFHAVPVLAAEASAADALAAILGPPAAQDASTDGAFCGPRGPERERPYRSPGQSGPQTKAILCAAQCVDGSSVVCVVSSTSCYGYVVNAHCPYEKGHCYDTYYGVFRYCPPCNSCKAGQKCV
jgi:hypothetical protein